MQSRNEQNVVVLLQFVLQLALKMQNVDIQNTMLNPTRLFVELTRSSQSVSLTSTRIPGRLCTNGKVSELTGHSDPHSNIHCVVLHKHVDSLRQDVVSHPEYQVLEIDCNKRGKCGHDRSRSRLGVLRTLTDFALIQLDRTALDFAEQVVSSATVDMNTISNLSNLTMALQFYTYAKSIVRCSVFSDMFTNILV